MPVEDPYRLTVVRPVCATCKHRADAKKQEAEEPWRDWLCLASEHEWWPEEYNPITGVTTLAKRGWKRCREVNSGGDCTQYEPAPAQAEAPPEPSEETPPTKAETGFLVWLVSFLGASDDR